VDRPRRRELQVRRLIISMRRRAPCAPATIHAIPICAIALAVEMKASRAPTRAGSHRRLARYLSGREAIELGDDNIGAC
jgi:hypothetical protein